MLRRSWQTVLSCSFLAGCVIGCGGPTPEKVFETWSSAVKANNFPAAWECLAPQTRGTVLQILVLDSELLSAANPAAKDAFGQVFSKYGLNPQDASFKQGRLQVANAGAYAADLEGVYRQFQSEIQKLETSRYRKLNAIWTASAQSGLGPSQAQGTRATAAVQGKIPHTPDNATVQAVFEKVDGSWRFAELEESGAAPSLAGGPAKAGGAATPGGPAMPGAGGAALPGGPSAENRPAGMADAKAGGAAPGSAPPPALAGNPAAVAGVAAGAAIPNGPLPTGPDPKAMPANPGAPLLGGGALGGGADPKAMPANPGGAAPPPGGAAGAGAAAAAGAGAAGGPAMAAKPPGDAAGAVPKADPKMADPAGGGAAAAAAGDIDRPGKGAANAGAANAGGANAPGNPAMANGGAQRAGGGRDGNSQSKSKPGSWEHAVEVFADRVASGDYTGLDYIISSRAKGLLAEIRNGEVSPERQEDLKATFASAEKIVESIKNTGAALVVPVKGKLGHTITLTVGKEDGVFKIKDMKISEPGATKKR